MNRKVRNRRTQFAFAATVLVALACPARAQQTSVNVQRQLARVDAAARTGPFRANWNSLAGYRAPEWFRDAKFGIFIHWGVYSVPAFGNEWYSRNMYVEGNAAFKHHVATYGPQSKFGYKDFIPMFRAEHFDANAWLDLFAQAGAPTSFRWPSIATLRHVRLEPYGLGRRKDGAEARRRRRVRRSYAPTRPALRRLFASRRALWWYDGGTKFDSDVRDPATPASTVPRSPWRCRRRRLEGAGPDHLERWLPPTRPSSMTGWHAAQNSSPNTILTFSTSIGGLASPHFSPIFSASLLTTTMLRQAAPGVVLTYKGYDFPENAATLDIEPASSTLSACCRGRLTPRQHSLLGYANNDEYRSAKSLIDELVDVVSKNGNLLLNVDQNPTAPFRAGAHHLARDGAWLKTNGEAIYGSRPWLVYGEGPQKSLARQRTPTSRNSRLKIFALLRTTACSMPSRWVGF